MRILVLRDRIDAFAIEINRDAAFVLQIAPIGLEPTRPAAPRQEAVGHDDIDLPAGCGQRTLGDQVAIAGHEHAPCLPLLTGRTQNSGLQRLCGHAAMAMGSRSVPASSNSSRA